MKAGFVTILGKPNVGKSTLLNSLVGTKVAIVSRRRQTTRDAIQGVLTEPRGQVVFVDSPGVHAPAKRLGKRMMREVTRATSGCHATLVMVDPTSGLSELDEMAVSVAQNLGAPAMLLVNKVDRVVRKETLLPFLAECSALHDFAHFIPISATKGTNLDRILDALFQILPESAGYYPEGFVTDQPERFLAAELIRERIPHSVAVRIERWRETRGRLLIGAAVVVERSGQKAILIGKQGAKMKQLATRARQSLEARFGRSVHLEVFVQVRKNWRNNPRFVDELDFRRIMSHG